MSLADWGDVPTWIGAGGAIGAALFAYQTITSQRKQISEQRDFIAEQSQFMAEQKQNLELERTELRAQADERRIAQARQVAWVFQTWGSSGRDAYGNSTGYDRWHVKVTNNSDDLIHDVMVRFGDTYNAASAQENEGFHHPDRGVRPVPVALIAAGHTVVFESPHLSEVTVDNNRPALLFTDDARVRWRRDSYGKLEEIPADGAA
ncbi:hypothetical protein OHA71_42720 [Streptomyces sp. NBC_00444]|uniref:hypothetical protein n=1 Tax=Streptomyces sp. NBC_00444 TaxID=2975744 RepID=UPI002E237BCE